MSTAEVPAVAKPAGQMTIRDRLKSPGMAAELAKVLPKHVTGERMTRVALTALTRIPKLAECDQASFFRCLLDLSQWGLEPDGRLAHLIPFENRKRGVVECQVIVDYKGYIQLAYRSGMVESINAELVREGDIFVWSKGNVVEHVPHFLRRDANRPAEEGPVFAVYCYVALKGGGHKTEVMSTIEVNSVRDKHSQGYRTAERSGRKDSPWHSEWGEMAKKTVLRRAAKWIPLSAEIRDAMLREDDQEAELTIDAKAGPQSIEGFEQLLAGPAESPTAPENATELSGNSGQLPESASAKVAAGVSKATRARLIRTTDYAALRKEYDGIFGPEATDPPPSDETKQLYLARLDELRAKQPAESFALGEQP